MPVTRFFGREDEIAQARARLDENRLVTLTGSGGVGKTRLSVRVAEDALREFTDGVWFVALAALGEPELVARQAAASLGLRDEPERSSLETLTHFLRQRQALLVLDNCEHVRAAAARLAGALLPACPFLKIMASSREPLGVDGEAIYRVPSLPFPSPGQAFSSKNVNDFASVRLFVDRARLMLPNYRIAAHNAAAIAHICQRLDGIPLALELAAARVKLLTAAQVASRLDDVLGLLTGGSHTALPRHRTLQATIQWSYDLLSPPEQQLLERLSVFAGGCTLAAAEAVCAGEGLAAGQMLDLLTALVDKSLVLAERQPNQDTRYRLLEMVRQFAAEKLAAAGGSAAIRSRHRDYFVVYLESNKEKLNSAEEIPWTAAVAAELDNVRLALEWSFRDSSAVEAGPRLAVEMIWLWPFASEALEWGKRAVAYCETHPTVTPRLYTTLLRTTAGMISHFDVSTALAWSKRAVELCRRMGPDDQDALMQALVYLGSTYFDILGDVERGSALSAEAEAIFEKLGPAALSPARRITWAAHFAQARGRQADKQGRPQEAKAFAAESVRLYRQVGSPNAIDPLIGLGAACVSLGEFDEADAHFRQALHETATLDTYWAKNRKNSALRWLGLLELRRGRLDQAWEYCQDALRMAAELSDDTIAASCLGLMARLAAQQDQPLRAARLAGAAQAMITRQGRKPWEDTSLDTLLPGWRARAEAAIEAAYAAGLTMTGEEAIAVALRPSEA